MGQAIGHDDLVRYIYPIHTTGLMNRLLAGPDGKVAAICGTDSLASVEKLGLATPGLVLDYRKPEGITGADSPLKNV